MHKKLPSSSSSRLLSSFSSMASNYHGNPEYERNALAYICTIFSHIKKIEVCSDSACVIIIAMRYMMKSTEDLLRTVAAKQEDAEVI